MDNRPIGIFDSGVGGLTSLKEVCDIMPSENIIYFGDTKHMPYGDKSKNIVMGYANRIIDFFESFGVKVILAACGTVSSYLSFIKRDVYGVIDPACRAAIKATKNKKIGVLGTKATIMSGAYGYKLSSMEDGIKYYSKACPLLAPLVEKGHINPKNENLRKIVSGYISPLVQENIDTLILGCTHYPLLSPVIRSIYGENLNLIDPGKEAAKFLKQYLSTNSLSTDRSAQGKVSFFVSGDENEFVKSAKIFLKSDIDSDIKRIDFCKEEI